MRKIVALIFSIFLLGGCATMANLEYRVGALEEKWTNNMVEERFRCLERKVFAIEKVFGIHNDCYDMPCLPKN